MRLYDFMVNHEVEPNYLKENTLDYRQYSPEIPVAGIFDEPNRCYKLNNEWAKIILGQLNALLEPQFWGDDKDERYTAIQNIMEFIKGTSCVTFELRQNPDNPCLLEQSLDGGQTWTTVYDYSLCNQIGDTSTLDLLFQQQFNETNTVNVTETTVNDVRTTSELSEEVGGDISDGMGGCDEDAAYGMAFQLTNYIHQRNLDFLENLTQAFGNIAEQASRLVSAAPFVGLLPFDEQIDYARFLVDELLQEYEATVDTQLLQDVACDLFCIATSRSPCSLDFADLINYFAGKVPVNLSNFSTTATDLITFGLTGNFLSDQYFYYMCYFQLWAAYIGTEWLGRKGLDQYGLQARAGKNSPDADWQIFCDPCDPVFWDTEWDFTSGDLQGWVIDENGQLDGGNGIKGTFVDNPFPFEDTNVVAIEFDIPAGLTIDISLISITVMSDATYPGGQGQPGSYTIRFNDDGQSIQPFEENFGVTADVPRTHCEPGHAVIWQTGANAKIRATARVESAVGNIWLQKVRLGGNEGVFFAPFTDTQPAC